MRFYVVTAGLVVALLAFCAPFSASAADEEAVIRGGFKPPAKDVVVRPGSRPPQNKPHGSVTLGRPVRPDYNFDKPGRDRPGRPDRDRDRGRDRGRDRDRYDGRDRDRDRDRYGDRDRRPGWDNRPGRYDGRDLSRGANCYPYCYGGVWPWGGDGNDDEEKERRVLEAAPPAEPERGFQSGGTFERFDDPRLTPPDAAGYPPSLGGGPDVPAPAREADQYRMMMEAWQ